MPGPYGMADVYGVLVGEGFIPPASLAAAAKCPGGMNASPTSYF